MHWYKMHIDVNVTGNKSFLRITYEISQRNVLASLSHEYISQCSKKVNKKKCLKQIAKERKTWTE